MVSVSNISVFFKILNIVGYLIYIMYRDFYTIICIEM